MLHDDFLDEQQKQLKPYQCHEGHEFEADPSETGRVWCAVCTRVAYEINPITHLRLLPEKPKPGAMPQKNPHLRCYNCGSNRIEEV